MMGHMKTSGMQRLSLSESAVARMIDPRTGEAVRPLGVTLKGRVIWPIMGASPDDPSNSDKDEDEGTDDDNPEGGKSKDSDEGGDSDDDKKSTDGNPDAKIEDLEQEKERHYRRRKDAEKERDAALARLKELEGKDTPEQEKLRTKVDEQESQINALTDSLQQSRLEVAFLKDNSFEWHNPGRALALADLKEVEIDDDGKVHGLKAALDKLAKSDPYLIKEPGKKEKSAPDAPDTSSSASNPSKKEKGKDAKDKQNAELLKKYPQLRR